MRLNNTLFVMGECPYLDTGHLGREDKSLVVAVHHDDDADRPGGDGPRVLVGEASVPCVGVFEGQVEHLREVLAEVVGGGRLDAATCGRDVRLHRGGEISTGELLLLRLAALDDWHGHVLLIDLFVKVDDCIHLLGDRWNLWYKNRA